MADAPIHELQKALGDEYDQGTVHARGFRVLEDVDGFGEQVVRVVVALEEVPIRGARVNVTWSQDDLLALIKHISKVAEECGIDLRIVTTLDPISPSAA